VEEEDPQVLCGGGLTHSECSRLTTLIRLISALCAGVTFLNIPGMLWAGHRYGILMESIFLPGYLLVFFLISRKRLKIMSHLFVINYILNATLGTLIFFTPDFGFHYYLLIVPTMVWILFPKSVVSKSVYSVIAIFAFYICEFTNGLTSLNITDSGSRTFFALTILIFTVGSMFCVRFYAHSIKQDTTHLSRMASTDPLTGLENRRFFNHTGNVDFNIMKSEKKSLSVLMIDLDHFKIINDNYGHDAGDKVLQKVAQTLQGSFRSADKICRYGGEEFLVLLKGTGTQDSLRIAEEVRQRIAFLDFPEYKDMRITTSIGVAHMTNEDEDLNQIIIRADKALYYAKNNGRNCVKDDQNSSIILCTI